MSDPPAGTVTFLFTDVEGSSLLWERHEAAMRAVTARHDALLDGIIVAHGGQRVRERGEGDSLFAVFARPGAAVAAALAMTRAMLAEPWPAETPILVRMGLHTGSAQFRAGDYYGPVVNRCARIRGLGHGGQVLLSAATAALVRDALPAGAGLRSLGAHSLKGLSATEEVFQLCHPDLPGDFPPLLSPQAPKHNLPRALSSLIGREAELGEALALLAEAPLVTLTGSGGVGKTRLALAVAAELVDQYADGVWLVELAPLADPGLAPTAVAQVLGVREEADHPLTTTLTEHLKQKHLLLVLDNCEHLVAACAALASTLMRVCPHLRILATSREGLAIAGERCLRVPSLTIPDPMHLPPPAITGSYEAVRLFVARARERRSGFVLSVQNTRAVAQICAHLDGIPLAIELAAARVGSMSVEAIAARLDDCFRLLTAGARDVLPRQRTLRAALDWSYDLLTASEQILLNRLSVFAGGWTLEGAESVCAGDGLEQWEILDLLGSLVNKSLAQAEEAGGEVRYGLLETVRQYGQERLAATGGAAGLRERHLAHFLDLAEEAAPQVTGPEQAAWLDRLEAEHDNLRAALRWSIQERGDAAVGLRLAGMLWLFWFIRGYLSEGRGWLEGVLARSDRGAPRDRARALDGAGNLAVAQDEYEQALALHQQELALQRELGDQQGISRALGHLGSAVAYAKGDYERARALLDESLSIARTVGYTRGMIIGLQRLGDVAYQQGDYARAALLFDESLVIARKAGNRRSIAYSLQRSGAVAYQLGEYARSGAALEEGLAILRELGDKQLSAGVLHWLGGLAYQQGDYRRARALFAESLVLNQTLGERTLVGGVLAGMAYVLAAEGRMEQAARLLGAAAMCRVASGVPVNLSTAADYAVTLATVQAALGDEAFAAAWAGGQALSLDRAVALALSLAENKDMP